MKNRFFLNLKILFLMENVRRVEKLGKERLMTNSNYEDDKTMQHTI